jgi:hypothetical protein
MCKEYCSRMKKGNAFHPDGLLQVCKSPDRLSQPRNLYFLNFGVDQYDSAFGIGEWTLHFIFIANISSLPLRT